MNNNAKIDNQLNFNFNNDKINTQNKPQQKTVDFDSFWNPGSNTAPKTTNINNNSNQFDQFANFFTTSNTTNNNKPTTSTNNINRNKPSK